MYAQIVHGRVVGLSERQQPFFDTPIDLPEDFDWSHIDRYELTESGELIRHDLPPEPISDTDAALMELAGMMAENTQRLDEQDAALIELAALIAGREG